MRVWPNRAFSGRGYAARERRRKFRAKVMRWRWGKDGDAAPLTQSLGHRKVVLEERDESRREPCYSSSFLP